MDIAKDGGSAFPVLTHWENGKPKQGAQTGNSEGWQEGMTLRDYFAAKAIAGIMRGWAGLNMPEEQKTIAAWAYGIADAMIARMMNEFASDERNYHALRAEISSDLAALAPSTPGAADPAGALEKAWKEGYAYGLSDGEDDPRIANKKDERDKRWLESDTYMDSRPSRPAEASEAEPSPSKRCNTLYGRCPRGPPGGPGGWTRMVLPILPRLPPRHHGHGGYDLRQRVRVHHRQLPAGIARPGVAKVQMRTR